MRSSLTGGLQSGRPSGIGAIWFPYRVRPNERTGPWGAAGYERFERLAGEDGLPVTMVEVTILYGERLASEPWWLASVPGNAVRAPAPGDHPVDPRAHPASRTAPRACDVHRLSGRPAPGAHGGGARTRLAPYGRPLIHNYGHGGSGFTLSWGCADEVARLALGAAA